MKYSFNAFKKCLQRNYSNIQKRVKDFVTTMKYFQQASAIGGNDEKWNTYSLQEVTPVQLNYIFQFGRNFCNDI